MKKNVLLFSALILLGVFFTSCAFIHKRTEVTYNYLDVKGNPDVFIDYIHEPLPVDYTIDYKGEKRIGEKLFTGWQDESGNIYKNGDTITLKDNFVLTAVYADAVSILYEVTCVTEEASIGCWHTDYAVKGSSYTVPSTESINAILDVSGLSWENFEGWLCITPDGVNFYKPQEHFTINENVLLNAVYSNYCSAYFVVVHDHKLPFGNRPNEFGALNQSVDSTWESGDYTIFNPEAEIKASNNFKWAIYVYDPETSECEQKATMGLEDDFVQALGGSSAIKPGSTIVILPDSNSSVDIIL
jgi:hypothetical protein